jgi:competence protein ComEC
MEIPQSSKNYIELGGCGLIRRPLVWIFCAYLTGLYLAWQKLPVILIILLMSFIFLIICYFMFGSKKKLMYRKDGFLWCLPFLLLFGFLAMGSQLLKPELYDAFDQKIICELSGEITLIVEKPKSTALYVKNVKVTLPGDQLYTCENVLVYCMEELNPADSQPKAATNYRIGNKITVQGTLKKFQTASNPGQFNEQQYYQIENIDFKMEVGIITVTDACYSKYHAYLGAVKNRLIAVYARILSDKEAGTLIAMLLGEKYLLDDEIRRLYQENGISHVLAISGLHVSLIGMFVFGLLKKLRCPIPLATFFTIFFIYSYGVLTNFSVSTSRAVLMMTILLLAPLPGKTYDMLSATALSALIILLQNPLQIMSAGFLLSYGAVLGISLIYPILKKLFTVKNAILNGVLISFSAQAATTPFVIYYFYQFPVYGILTNLIILPLITVLTLSSIIAGLAGAICIPLGIFLIGGANYILKFYEWICRVISSLPGNLLTVGRPDSLRMLLYFILLLLFLYVAAKYRMKNSVILLIFASVILLLPHNNPGLEVTFLDVGQGDAIFMESGSGTTYLIDGGSADVKGVGTYRIIPFLMSQGTDRLDYAIMTHSDSDHISGLTELIGGKQISISNLILPDITNKDEAYIKLEALAEDTGITMRYIKAGDMIEDGDLSMTCLHPVFGYIPLNRNSYSTVFSLTYKEFDLLLTGDLQKDGERMVIDLLNDQVYWSEYKTAPVKGYDILKVAHHGSKYSTLEEFLSLIKPKLSVISCGKDNFYGHPHAEALERLNNYGSNVMITYATGAVTVRTDGKRMIVEEYRYPQNMKSHVIP